MKMDKLKATEELIGFLNMLEEIDFDYLHSAIIKKIKRMHEFYATYGAPHNNEQTNTKIAHELSHLIDLNDAITTLRESSNYSPKKERKLFKDFYNYLGAHITEWHDYGEDAK
jgi:hypothetical protein